MYYLGEILLLLEFVWVLHSTARTNAGPWHVGRNGKRGTRMEGDPRRENSFNKEAKSRLRAEYLGNKGKTGLSQSGDK